MRCPGDRPRIVPERGGVPVMGGDEMHDGGAYCPICTKHHSVGPCPGSSPSNAPDLGQFLNDLADAAVAVIETESMDEVDLGLKAIRSMIDENVALALVACVRRLVEVDPRASEIDVLCEVVRS